jgi:hypothetical protein
MSNEDLLRSELERRARESAELERRAREPSHSWFVRNAAERSQWTPAVVTAMIGSTLATIGSIVSLVVNRPEPPPNMSGVAKTVDVDAIEERTKDAERAAKRAARDLEACESQFRGFDERLRSIEKGR